MDRDPCGVGDDCGDLAWYVFDPGCTPSDGRNNDHNDGMGVALLLRFLRKERSNAEYKGRKKLCQLK